jgi:hypothetical protein
LLLQLRLLERCHGAVHRRLYLIVEAGSAATLRLLLLLLNHLLLSLCRLLDVLLLLCHCLKRNTRTRLQKGQVCILAPCSLVFLLLSLLPLGLL